MGRQRPAETNRHIAKYLAPNESVVLGLRQHWARVLPAIVSCLTGLFLVLVIGFTAPANLGVMTNAAWWLWLVLVLHLLWRLIEWRDETFVITDRRIILVYGIFVKKVAMMPLSKVTDMSYNRSLAARILGYGTFVMESAGQEQALSTIDFVRNPDGIYRSLCGLIFGEDQDGGSHSDNAAAATDPPAPSAESWDGRWENSDWETDSWDAHTHRRPTYGDERGDGDPDHGWHTEQWDEVAHDGTTRPMPVRGKAEREVDDTDPYGLVTDRSRLPHRPPHSPYAERITRGEDDLDDESAWSVSHEHATRPQPAQRSRHVDSPVNHWDDA